MKVNADLSQRALVDSAGLPWVPSPLPGVERRMLERDGDEVARVTSLVRYAPGSHFSAHSHSGGEEFLVLEGSFSDDYGDFPAGTYVRNPVGSRHRPRSDDGTVILVKLWWMHPEDQDFVRIDTTQRELWREAAHDGVAVLPLHRHGAEATELLELSAGTHLPARALPGGEELFVSTGSCRDENGVYRQGTWLRHPIGGAPELVSPQGCRIFLKRGHLEYLPPSPGHSVRAVTRAALTGNPARAAWG